MSTTWLVTSTADDGSAGTLRNAVQYSAAGDTIQFSLQVFPAGSTKTINLNGSYLDINHDLTIQGPASATLVVSGNQLTTVFFVGIATASISNLQITGGKGQDGGGIDNSPYGSLTLSNCTISGNSAGSGGGIYNAGAMSLANCAINNNTARNGGGILNLTASPTPAVTITNCSISNNTATTNGGGIDIYAGSVAVTGSTISGNSSASGGGIDNEARGSAALTNSTIANNSSSGYGGGILDDGFEGTLTAANVTIAGNFAQYGGGGLRAESGTETLNNTIVAGNTSNPGSPRASDIYLLNNGYINGSYDLIGTPDYSPLNLNGTANRVGVSDPGLMPLGSYGGTLQTVALKPTSLAINAGSNALVPAGVLTDQRGLPRISGQSVDIGAYEVQSGFVVNTTADPALPTAGTISLRQALQMANADTADGALDITFDPAVVKPYSQASIVLTQGALELSHTVGAVSFTAPVGYEPTVWINGSQASRVFVIDPGVTVSIANMDIGYGRSTGDGGAILNNGALTLTNCWMGYNSSQTRGGTIATFGPLTLNSCRIENSVAASGGGIFDSGAPVSIQNSWVDGDSAAGGAVLIAGGTLTMSTTAFWNNSTSSNTGTGLQNNGGVVHVANCSFLSNQLSGAASQGAALWNSGTLTVDDSWFQGNSAVTGGTIYNTGIATISQCTFNENQATDGGAIYSNVPAGSGGKLVITDCTIAGNTATRGGGIENAGAATINNTIVASNLVTGSSTPSDIYGAVSGAYDLVSDGTGQLSAANHNVLGTAAAPIDPKLAPMGLYGGSGWVMPLLAGSPALNAGNNSLAVDSGGSPLTTDQRGLPRVYGAAVDIGAYEAQPTTTPSNVGAFVGADELQLSWNVSSGATTYNIYRGLTPGGEAASPIATGIYSNSFTDPNVVAGTTYYYKVAAVNAYGETAPSIETSAAPVLPIINVVGGTFVSLTQDYDGQHIDWTAGNQSGNVRIADPNGLTINNSGPTSATVYLNTNKDPLPAVLHLSGQFLVENLSATGNPLAGHTIDIGTSTVLLSYSPGYDPSSLVRQWLKNGTATNGMITSLATASHPGTTIGFADSADGTGVNPTANSIELKFTELGDANLDGSVNLLDLLALIRNFGKPASWDTGDFNSDGTTNRADFLTLTRNFGQSLVTASIASAYASAGVATSSGPAIRRRV